MMTEEKVERALNQARVSNELEDIEIKEEYTKLVKDRLMNKITEDEFKQKAKELAAKK